jgi:hypothetical protein
MGVTNNLPSSKIRFSFVTSDGSAYCLNQLSAGTNTVHFTTTATNCYGTGGTALTTSVADTVVSLQWQVPTSPAGTTSFDFCIDHLTPLTQ